MCTWPEKKICQVHTKSLQWCCCYCHSVTLVITVLLSSIINRTSSCCSLFCYLFTRDLAFCLTYPSQCFHCDSQNSCYYLLLHHHIKIVLMILTRDSILHKDTNYSRMNGFAKSFWESPYPPGHVDIMPSNCSLLPVHAPDPSILSWIHSYSFITCSRNICH